MGTKPIGVEGRLDSPRIDPAAMLIAGAITLFHLATTAGYGIFRDEMYYLACARHLDWGYVDHPPLVAVFAWIVSHTLGTSLLALRLLPALAAGATVLLSAAIARHLGGGRFAQCLAGLAVALAPQYMGMLSIYSMNAFDLVVWSAMILVFMQIVRDGGGRKWLLFGALAGIGLENKLSVLFLGFGLVVGMVATRQWRLLRDRYLWLGAGLAALLFAPHVIWQAAHGWPTSEFVRRATEFKNVAFSPLEFMGQQVLMTNPVAMPLWVAGLGYLLFARRARPYRSVGIAYLAVLGLMLTQNAKPYYLAPIYPVLLAAGAVVLEGVSWGRAFVRPAALAAIAVSGALLAPLAKPLLPEDTYVNYSKTLGIQPGTDERKSLGRLPQHFADMHGWQQLAESVARVHQELPAEERSRACVFGQNYGHAGAIDFFGPRLGLPRAISGHNSYWMWGPGECDGQVMIVIGGRHEDLVKSFAEVAEGGRYHCSDCMPYEDKKTIWVARGLRIPIAEAWPRTKHFD